jgi:hypothetical protein
MAEATKHEDLEQVVLHDVADDAEAIKVAAAAARAEVLLERDLDGRDVVLSAPTPSFSSARGSTGATKDAPVHLVPDRLEDLVGEAQRHEVEHDLLAEVCPAPGAAALVR